MATKNESLKGKIALATVKAYISEYNLSTKELFLKNLIGGKDIDDSCRLLSLSPDKITAFYDAVSLEKTEAKMDKETMEEIAAAIIKKYVERAIGLMGHSPTSLEFQFVKPFVGASKTIGFSHQEVSSFLYEIFKELGKENIFPSRVGFAASFM